MGTVFNQMHVRLVAALNDVKLSDGSQITLAADDGKKRTSAQRSRDLMDGRYYLMSMLRVIDKQMFYGNKVDVAFSATGYLDITTFGVINHKEISLVETTSAYNKTVPVKDGDELPIYREFLRTCKTEELVAAVISDNSSATRKTQLQLYKGANLSTAFDAFKFDIGYYTVPVLIELDSSSSADITEPRIWWPIIESYAAYMGWLGSGNTKRAINQLNATQKLSATIVQNEYGASASQKVSDVNQVAE